MKRIKKQDRRAGEGVGILEMRGHILFVLLIVKDALRIALDGDFETSSDERLGCCWSERGSALKLFLFAAKP